MKKVKILPLVMTIVSFLYFIYVVSSGNTKMIGDEIGGDPGGMILPLVLSVFMFLGFLYITLTERPDGEGKGKSEVGPIFIVTLLSAVLYVLLHSLLGFVICSSLMTFVLLVAYQALDVVKISVKKYFLGALTTLASTLVVYSIFRYVTRTLLSLGRRGLIPSVFGNSNVTAFLSLLIVVVFLLLSIFALYRKIKGEDTKILVRSGIISFATTLFLYIIFKQFFLVSLAPGIINW